MKKDFAKKKSAYNWSLAKTLLLSITIIVICALGIFLYRYKNKPQLPPAAMTYFSRVEKWVNERRHSLLATATPAEAKAKKMLAKDVTPAPIHFEFYTALPAMQMTLPDEPSKLDKPVSVAAAKLPLTKKVPTELVSKTLVQPAKIKIPHIKPPILAVNPTELEQELARQLKPEGYFVQLGVFKNVAIAERFRKSLVESSLDARIVKKMAADKPLYRIQLGPYANKAEAVVAQKKVQKKGINGILRKSDK